MWVSTQTWISFLCQQRQPRCYCTPVAVNTPNTQPLEPGTLGEMAYSKAEARNIYNDPAVSVVPKSKDMLKEIKTTVMW